MKIVHICTGVQGGAALGALKLCMEMSKHGIDSIILTKENLSNIQPPPRTLLQRLSDKISRKFSSIAGGNPSKAPVKYQFIGTWSDGTGNKNLLDNPNVQKADIVYLHWINKMLSIEEIGRLLASGKKVVWIMRDMWPMTGGCHYSLECELYKTHCTNCPLVEFDNQENLSAKVFDKKLQFFVGHPNLVISGISRWISDCAKQSRLFRENDVFTIPNIMDADVYHPIRKEIAREVLQLPQDKKLILFGAVGGTKNFYKGWSFLKEALGKLDASYELVVFGEDYNEDIVQEVPLKVLFLGKIFDHKTMFSLIYSAADVYVSPTLAESFGKTIAESSLCGTPVVCFGIGGTLDLVKHQQTGYLAKYKDSDDLLQGIQWVISNNTDGVIGRTARKYINSFCNSDIVINQHREMWKTLGWI